MINLARCCNSTGCYSFLAGCIVGIGFLVNQHSDSESLSLEQSIELQKLQLCLPEERMSPGQRVNAQQNVRCHRNE